MASAIRGAIIAAGEGSRLRADGYRVPKPLVEVAGLPLIEAVLAQLHDRRDQRAHHHRQRAGAGVRRLGPDAVPRARRSTSSSRPPRPRSRASGEVTGRGPARAGCSSPRSTRGARPEDFARFVGGRRVAGPHDATVLAVTPFVADEKPLWVTLGGGRTRGSASATADSGLVTAGLYRVSDRARRLAPAAGPRAAARLPGVAARHGRAALRGDHRDGGGRGPGGRRGHARRRWRERARRT